MIQPPTTIGGAVTLKAKPGVSPTLAASSHFTTAAGDEALLRMLRWKFSDFSVMGIPESEDTRNWTLRTFEFVLGEEALHLVQHDSSFWSSAPMAATAGRPPRHAPGAARPQWQRRSQRYWPCVNGRAVPFIAQTFLDGSDVYVFRTEQAEVLLHAVERHEQDVEDHYGEEERRRMSPN